MVDMTERGGWYDDSKFFLRGGGVVEGDYKVVRRWDGAVVRKFSNKREALIFIAGLMWAYRPDKRRNKGLS